MPSAVESPSCMATAVGGQNRQQGFPALPASRTSAGSCFSHLHQQCQTLDLNRTQLKLPGDCPVLTL